ncbi:hypothetical protein RQP46_001494 [Phenoliferia psychrophenolica]
MGKSLIGTLGDIIKPPNVGQLISDPTKKLRDTLKGAQDALGTVISNPVKAIAQVFKDVDPTNPQGALREGLAELINSALDDVVKTIIMNVIGDLDAAARRTGGYKPLPNWLIEVLETEKEHCVQYHRAGGLTKFLLDIVLPQYTFGGIVNLDKLGHGGKWRLNAHDNAPFEKAADAKAARLIDTVVASPFYPTKYEWGLRSSFSDGVVQTLDAAGQVWQMTSNGNILYSYGMGKYNWASVGYSASGPTTIAIAGDAYDLWKMNSIEGVPRQLVTSGKRLWTRDEYGQVFEYLESSNTWDRIDRGNSSPAIQIASADGRLFQLLADGTLERYHLWRYTGVGTGWEQIDDSPTTTGIACSPGGVFQLQSTGRILQYTSPPLTGWRVLQYSSNAKKLYASSTHLSYVDYEGQLFRLPIPSGGASPTASFALADVSAYYSGETLEIQGEEGTVERVSAVAEGVTETTLATTEYTTATMAAEASTSTSASEPAPTLAGWEFEAPTATSDNSSPTTLFSAAVVIASLDATPSAQDAGKLKLLAAAKASGSTVATSRGSRDSLPLIVSSSVLSTISLALLVTVIILARKLRSRTKQSGIIAAADALTDPLAPYNSYEEQLYQDGPHVSSRSYSEKTQVVGGNDTRPLLADDA